MSSNFGRLVLLGTAVLFAGLAIMFTPGSAQVGSGGSKAKDLAELKTLTGGDVKVSVYLINNPTVLTGRLKSLTNAAGKNFLQLQGDGTEMILINVDAVAAIRQVFN